MRNAVKSSHRVRRALLFVYGKAATLRDLRRIPFSSLALLAGTLAFFGCGERDPLEEARRLQAGSRFEDSVEILQKLIEEGDRRPEVVYRYGRGLSAMGEVGRSVWALDAAIDEPEYALPAALELARNALQGGNHDLALQTLARLKAARPDEGAEEDVRVMLLEARTLLESRRFYAQALELAEQVLDLQPDNEQALRFKVVALLGDKQSDEAAEVIEELAAAEPQAEAPAEGAEADEEGTKASPYWCTIGVSFNKDAGDLEEAERIASICLDRYPDEPGVISSAVEIFALRGKHDESVRVLREAYEQDRENMPLGRSLVKQLYGLGRFDEAEQILSDALEFEQKKEFADDATLAAHHGELGRFLIDRDRVDEGLEHYDRVLELTRGRPGGALLLSRAEALVRVGRLDEALAIADETPVDVHAPMIRGRVAYEQGDYEKALEELSEASRTWPNNAPVRYYLALAAEGTGDFDRAVEEYRQTLRSKRELSAARVRLARLHLAENRVAQALAIMRLFAPRGGNAMESLDSKRVMVAIQARSGQLLDLRNFPPDADRSTEEIHASVIDALGEALRRPGADDRGAGALAQIQANSPDVLADPLLAELVESLVAADRVDDALGRARAAQGENPSVFARVALARALLARDPASSEARGLLSSVDSTSPGHAAAQLLLARGEAARGETEGAVSRLASLLEGDVRNPEAMLELARLLSESGRTGEAVERLEPYLARVDPYDGRLALELARLLEASDTNAARRVELGVRALRFGAGADAVALLRELDPGRFGELGAGETSS